MEKFKIAILGERKDVIFFKGLGFEVFFVNENFSETLKEIEKRKDLGILFITQDVFSKIDKEILKKISQKKLPAIVSLPIKEKDKKEELKEIIKKAIGKEEISI